MNAIGYPIRWGIIGCGRIAGKFCASMDIVPSGRITACASRTPGRAREFAQQNNIPNPFDDYQSMLECGLVDAVYVATTHNFHHANMMLCFEHGKAVLCEKPLTISAEQTAEVIAKAREKHCFLMEGMWTRFLPSIQKMRRWLKDGRIGDLKMLRADLCFRAPHNPKDRLLNPDLAGGAYLDLGIYPVSMASDVMGRQPERIQVIADIGTTGVDEQTACLFDYGDGRMALLSFSLVSRSQNRMEIVGTDGMIIAPEQFLRARKIELHIGEKVTIEDLPFPEEKGFCFQIEAVHEALARGEIECAVMPLDETLAIAKTMDAIRDQFPS